MLQKKSSLALIPKARGLFAHRLTEREYDELMHKRSVAEIGAYLKNHPYFRDSLSGIQDTQVHRRRLEELLSLAASEDGLLRFMEGYRLGFRLALAGLRDDA